MIELGKFYTLEELKGLDNLVNIPGIYCLFNTKSKRKYIGQGASIGHRLIDHFSLLPRGKHKNRILQRSFNKYGITAFRVSVLVICENFEFDAIEDSLVRKWDTVETGYNLVYPLEDRKRERKKDKRGVKYKISNEKVAEIRRLYVKGCHITYISEVVQVSHHQCSRICTNKIRFDPNYVPPKQQKGFILTEPQIDEINDLFTKGYSKNKVCNLTGIGGNTIDKFCSYFNIKPSTRKPAALVLDLKTKVYYKTIKDAAEAFGVSKATMRTWILQPSEKRRFIRCRKQETASLTLC